MLLMPRFVQWGGSPCVNRDAVMEEADKTGRGGGLEESQEIQKGFTEEVTFELDLEKR